MLYSIFHVSIIIVFTALNLNPHFNQKNYNEAYISIFLLSFSGIVMIFLLVVVGMQMKYILSNVTTSEELRKNTVPIPDFDNGSAKLNLSSFCGSIMDYRDQIDYNGDAKNLLDANITLMEYKLTTEGKIEREIELRSTTSTSAASLNDSSDIREIPMGNDKSEDFITQ